MVEGKKRRLARCFVVMKLPATPTVMGEGSVPPPTRSRSDDKPRPSRTGEKGAVSRNPSSSTSVASSSTSLSKRNSVRPSLSTASSRSSVTRTFSPPSDATPRTRTTSLTSIASSRSSAIHPKSPNTPGGKDPLLRSVSNRSQGHPTLVRSGSDASLKRPGLSSPRGSLLGPSKSHPTITSSPSNGTPARPKPETTTPFFISPIHPPSTQPRFHSLSPETDFAPWLTVEESAEGTVELDLWAESNNGQWRRVDSISGTIDLSRLRRVPADGKLPGNTLEFTLSTDPKAVFYLPHRSPPSQVSHANGRAEPPKRRKGGDTERGVVERSLRETRMKTGIGVGGLHQYVALQLRPG